MSSPKTWTSKDLAEKLQLQRSDTYGNFQTSGDITKKKCISLGFDPFIFCNF